MVLPAYIDEETGAITDGEAWVAITSTLPGSATASITFTSTDDGQVGDFSQYMDLVVLAYARSDYDIKETSIYTRINGNSASVYTTSKFQGDGSSANPGSFTWTGAQFTGIPGAQATANAFCAGIVEYLDINSGKYITILGQGASNQDGGSTYGKIDLWVVTVQSQASVSSVYLACSSGDFVAGSRFDLFGVLPRMVA